MTLTSDGGCLPYRGLVRLGLFRICRNLCMECGYFMLFQNKRGGPVGGRLSNNHEIRIVFQKYDLLTSCRDIS